MNSRGSVLVPFVLAVLLFAGAIAAKLALSGDPRCLVMNCIVVK